MKKNNKIKIGAIVLVLAVGGIAITRAMGSDVSSPVNYTQILPSELINSISTKGTVESITKRNVYSTLSYMVKEVNVEVGDKIVEGQVMCKLDTENLELNIAQQKADLSASQKASLNQLQNSKRIYNEAVTNLNSGTSSQIISAEASLKTAEVNLENAQKVYNDTLKDFQSKTNAQLVTAQGNLTSAELDLDTKKTAYENNKYLFGSGGVSQDTLNQSETAYTNAQNKYNDALISVENAEEAQKRDLEKAENSLKSAQISHENARLSLNSANTTAKQDLEKYQSSVNDAQIVNNNDSKVIAIQKLEKELEDSVVKSPINGTVTAVYAKEGAAGTGLLFVVEDTDNLKITTKIREYDEGKVRPGMNVTIKSDSTGDAVFEGVLDKIDPTAIKNNSGENVSTSDVEFGAEVAVAKGTTDLKVGMNTRLNIILEKKDNIYYVPYDAVKTNAEGESILFIAVEDSKNKYKAQQIPVTTGMETDFYIEVSGDGLADEMKVISDASDVNDGMQVKLS